MIRPLSPRSEREYSATLERSFVRGADRNLTVTLAGLKPHAIEHLGNSSLNQLKCAARWYRRRLGLPPKDVTLEDALAPRYTIAKQPYTPAEVEIVALERAVADFPIHEKSAIFILLYLGLRAEEFYALPRKAVERAALTGSLAFVRKGGMERTVDASKVAPLFDALLTVPAKHPKGSTPARPKAWKHVGEVYSSGKPMSQYHALRRLTIRAAKKAGLPNLSPHKLRHAFATRLNRDGASVFVIQAALNHKSIQTSQRYVHASAADVAKFMRGPTEEK